MTVWFLQRHTTKLVLLYMTLEIQFLPWDRHKNANNDIIPNNMSKNGKQKVKNLMFVKSTQTKPKNFIVRSVNY
jgi:hypothetical protein